MTRTASYQGHIIPQIFKTGPLNPGDIYSEKINKKDLTCLKMIWLVLLYKDGKVGNKVFILKNGFRSLEF